MAQLTKNITVACRVRALEDHEEKSDDIYTVNANKISIVDKSQPRSFEFDKVYDRSSTNDKIFSDLLDPLLPRFLSGYNCYLFVYGASYTGKSHTLYGSAASTAASNSINGSSGGNKKDAGATEGLVQQLADSLFTSLTHSKSNSFLTVSMYNIYQTNVLDLLNPNTKTSLQLSDSRSGANIDAVALEVQNSAELKGTILQGLAVSTAMRLRSLGQAHTIVEIRLDMDGLTSTFRLVEFAGSGGMSLKLNPGLQALSKVIDALSTDPPGLPPFQLTKLTKLIEGGLGGNSVAAAIITLEGRDKGAGDAFNSLETGEKMKKIKNIAKMNKNTNINAIREIRDEIKKIRGKLNLTQPGQYMHDLDPSNLKILKSLLVELDKLKLNTIDKRRELSIQWQNDRKKNLEQEGLLYTLVENIDIPENITISSKNLLVSIVQQKAMIDDTENELNEKKNLYQLRLDAHHKKVSAGADPNVKDEKLTKLEKVMLECEDKLKSQQTDLFRMQDEYKKILSKISTIESKQRKLFLINNDTSGLTRLNRAQEWSEMKKEMDDDSNLQGVLSMIESNTNMARDSIAQNYGSMGDAGIKLKEEALNTMNALKEQTTLSKKLEWERDHLWGKLIESQLKQEVHMQKYQEHMFFIFRNYRSHFEEQKDRTDSRYRELLESSIKDALKLSEENARLKAQLEAKLRQI